VSGAKGAATNAKEAAGKAQAKDAKAAKADAAAQQTVGPHGQSAVLMVPC
jgi:hypothetical protein